MVGRHLSSGDSQLFIDACLKFLRSEYPELQMIVSAGKNGAYAFSRGSYEYGPAPEVTVASTAGAGDALLGGVLAGLVAGIPLLRAAAGIRPGIDVETVLDLGVLLASYKCLSPHTIHPSASLDSLDDFARTLGRSLRFRSRE